MKIKAIFLIFSFVGLIFVASCGNDVSTSETKNVDSVESKLPEVLIKLNEQIAAEPNNAVLYHKRAKYYLETRNFDAGFEDMRKVMTLDSSKASYFITLSDLYFVTNQTGNSKASLEKCLSLDNKNVEAMLKLGELYFYVKKHDKCFEYLNMALKIDKYNSKAYFMKGMNYKELKDTAKAISSMQTAVEQDQNYYSAYIQLGLLNAAQKNPIAIEYYRNAIRIQPNSIEALYNLGKFYQDMNDFANANAYYKAVVKIDPKNKFAYFNMGAMELANKKSLSTVSLTYFTNAINIDPKYIDAYYGRGVCHKLMGEKKEAINDFQACLALDPQYELATVALKALKTEK